ncbi:hypothetical protein BUALT_Bualt01G0175700 [Buddleja alternifolia]|uniref:Retrotransposon gag domain-containing protein n=1 Tax=Buddleja alternifolia TaxID=168488 RepID=A0AAV6YEG0_9LAMI|nr:hypothetical protein BUALT_Bualt01G0175700 [Buddleja alternifolia]
MGTQTGMQAAMEANHRMLQQKIQSMADQMPLYNKKKSVLGEGLSVAQERGSTSQVRMQHALNCEGNQHHNSYTPFSKVDFPHYDGDNTRTWIKKCNRYFQIVSTITEDQKVPLASIHLEGKAELWFQSFMEGRDLPNWLEFISVILERFYDQDPELIVGEFNKLHQSEEEELTYNQNLEVEEEANEDFKTDDMTISLNALSGSPNLNHWIYNLKSRHWIKSPVKIVKATQNATIPLMWWLKKKMPRLTLTPSAQHLEERTSVVGSASNLKAPVAPFSTTKCSSPAEEEPTINRHLDN